MSASWMRHRGSGIVAIVGCLAALLGASNEAAAWQVKRVVRGTSTVLDASTEVATVDISGASYLNGVPLDPTKSIVLITRSINDNREPRAQMIAIIDDSTHLLFARNASTTATTIEWTVVEFVSGVTVTSGISPLSETATTKTITLPQTYTTSKTFPLITLRATANALTNTATDDYYYFFTADMGMGSTTNTLTLTRKAQTARYNVDIAYQIVTFDEDINVQHKVMTMAAASPTLTASSPTDFATVNAAKSFLLFTTAPTSATGGNEDYYPTDGTLNSAGNTLTFRRFSGVASGTVDVSWYLVELQHDAAYSQTGQTVVNIVNPTVDQTVSPSPSAFVLGRTMALATASVAATIGTSGFYDIAIRAKLSGTNTLTLSRETPTTPNVNANVSWFITELPALKLTYPVGGEVLKVNDPVTITWKHADSEAGNTVFLELTTTGNTSDTCATSYPLTITSGVSATADTYAWTIPPKVGATNLIGTALRMKIRDGALTSPYNCDLSNGNFQIKGKLTITAPVGGETWTVGDTIRTINWDTRGDFNGAGMTGTISYSTTGCSGSWTAITSSYNLGTDTGTGTSNNYPWNPVDANAMGTNTCIKIALNSEASPVQTVTTSPTVFTVKRYLGITAPVGGETGWESKKIKDITWDYKGNTSGSPLFGNVKLEFTTDGGVNWNPVQDANNPNASNLAVDNGSAVGNTPPYTGKGRYPWYIPDTAIGNVKVRVTSLSDTSVASTSPATVAINPSIRVDVPTNAGLKYYVETTNQIDWTCSPTVSKMKIELRHSTDGSIYSSTLIADAQPATNVDSTHGKYTTWAVPDQISAYNKIRLTGEDSGGVALSPLVQDDSDNDFEIRGRIDNVAPASGSFGYGVPIAISWTPHGTLGTVAIKLSTNNGGDGYPTTLNTMSGNAPATWSWPNATTALGANYRIRIEQTAAAGDPLATGDGTGTFAIKGTITAITFPNAGTEIFPVGSNQTITWTRSPNDATFEPFKVDYSLDNGVSWTTPNGGTICSSQTGASCAWNNIPATALTTQLRIRVSLVSDATVTKTNDNPAKIRGTLTLTSPVGNTDVNLTDKWYVGETRSITWSASPSVQGNIRLIFSTDGTTFPAGNIISSTVASSDLSYPWSVPSVAQSENFKIKIENVNDTGVNSASSFNCKARGRVDLTSPDGGLPFLVVGGEKNITWTTYGSVPNIRLYYSSNGNSPPWTEITAGPIANAGAALWSLFGSVPDAIGTTTRVKVQDSAYPVDYPSNENISAGDFEIKGDLVFDPTTPPANAILRVGGSYLLQWTKKGTLTTPTQNIKLLYSINDGSNFPDPSQLIATVTGTSHNWLNIPDAARGDTVKLKVQWEGDSANAWDVSPQIKVKPSVNLTSPDSGTYHIGDSLPVNFTHTGRSGDIFRVLYSTNGGSTYPNPTNVIGTYSNGAGATGALSCSGSGSTGNYSATCTWTIPNVAGIVDNDLKIRVELVGDETNVNDESQNNLTFLGKLQLTYPANQSMVLWTVGDTNRTVTWDAQGITTIRIDYTKNDGADSYGNVITTAGTGGAYTWNPIPSGAVCDTCKIRIKAQDTPPLDNVTTDTTTMAFRIKPSLTLTYPVGGEVMIVGTATSAANRTITWSYSGTLDFVDLYYTKDTTGDTNGDGIPDPPQGTWVAIATGAGAPIAGNLSYVWPSIPDDITSNARIVITKKADAVVKDVKSSFFKIRGDLHVDQPDATGIRLPIATNYDIKWTPTGTLPGNVKLEYSTNGFADETQTFPVTGPAGESAANLPPGATGVQQTFTWKIPNAPSPSAKVRVTSLSDTTVSDASNNVFSVIGSLFVDVPNGGEVWTVGSAQSLQWHKFGAITTVNLYYSKNNGADSFPYTIATGVAAGPDTGTSLPWPSGVPDAIGDQLLVKIVDASDSSVTDTSNGTFSVKGDVHVDTPNNTTTRFVGDPLTIQWTPTGTIGPVTIQYSTDGFADELQNTTVISSYSDVSNAYALPGGVPDAIGNTVRFRVKSQQSQAPLVASDVSDVNFAIKGKLTLQPVASEYVLGDPITLNWTPSGTIGNVKVEYTADGNTWNMITATAPQAGPYAFTLDASTTNFPAVATNLAKVRISAANDGSVSATSATFTIKPFLTVGTPVSGNTWIVGSTHAINWTSKGTNITTVKIEYTSNGGSSYQPVLEAEGTANDGIVTNDGSFTWTVPDEIGASPNLKIKISTIPTSDPWAVSAFSGGLAQIIGALQMTVPNDTIGIKWRVGSPANVIGWTATGSITNVKLDYSLDSGTNWSPVAATAPSGVGPHTYSWNIPATTSLAKDTVRFRACDAANTNICDTADANNSLVADFAIAHPINGDVWVATTTNAIQWSTPTSGVPATVKIEYTLDGSTWNPIPENDGTANDGIVTNGGTRNWTLGAPLSTSAKIHMSDPADVDSLVPGTTFKIRGDLTLTAPNTGAESWEVDSVNPITWTKKGNISAVKLQLSTNNGSSYSAMVDGTGADTQNIDVTGAGPTYTFNWKVPTTAGILSTQAFVRVVDANDSTVFDPSDAAFTLKGRVTLATPNGGQTLQVGGTYAITGTVFGPITAVNLYLSTNSGSTYAQLPSGNCDTTAVSAGSFSCTWTVPDQIKGTLRIKAADANNTQIVSESAADFAIKGSATFQAPVGTSVWIAGDPFSIVWDRIGTILNVDLFYSVNGGAFQSIAGGQPSPTQTGNSYQWTLPTTAIVSNNVRVKIDGTNMLAPVTSAAFTVKGKLALTYPDASGIALTLGDPLNVTWNAAGDLGNVKVEYYDGSAWSTIATTAPQNGPLSFTLDTPNTTVATSAAKVRITDADDAAVTSTSTSAFTVQPYLLVTSPAGNESWPVNSTQTITWAKKGSNVTNVKIAYSKDSGSTYNDVIFNSTANDGTEPWPIPDDIQAVKNMKIKIFTLPVTDPFATTAVSSGLFQIVGGLTMAQPNDTTGIKWRINSNNNDIRWNAVGSIATVKLEYSTDSGTNWSLITSSAPSGAGTNKSYMWTIPGTIAPAKDTLRIRVSDTANSNVLDTADASSSLLANFTFTAPTAGNVWVAETSNDIQWTTPVAGVPANVKLEYTLDGTNYTTIASSTTNSGTKTWSLPVNLSASAKIRISDTADANSALDSAAFKIRGDLTVTSPNIGTESWDVASLYPITWTKKGAITAVKLQLSTNSGGAYAAMVDGDSKDTQNVDVTGAGPAYTFNWRVPDQAGILTTAARVRVIDANDATVMDDSNSDFVIKGHVTLSTPNGSQTLTVGTPYTISGTVFGPLTNVKLYLSTNGGSTYAQLPSGNCDAVAVSGGAFSCNWNVPDQLGANMKIKVADANNSLVLDESDAAFAIKGSATVTAPVPGNIWFAGDTNTISWSRTGTIGTVDLSYSVNNGAYVAIASGVDSSGTTNNYSWPVPTDQIVSANVKIKIDGVNLVAPALSPAITVKGKITLTYPDASGITLTLGDPLNVTWSAVGDIGPVKVEYFDGSSYSTITTTAPQNGPFSFNLDTPNTTVATAGAKVRVSDADDATVIDESANVFMVKPLVQVTAPAGNEAWMVGTTQTLTWAKKGSNIANMKIAYSKDSGATYNDVIFNSTANDGTEPWVIPDDIQSVKNMKVKIFTLPLTDPFANSAVSTGLFQIVGGLTMAQPNDTTGVKWRVGTTGNEIKWDAVGSIANVKLEYSTDSGTNWSTLVASTPSGAGSGKSYAWAIPANAPLAKDTIRFRVLDAANTNVFDMATAASSLLADFTFAAPLAGNIWVAETSNDIQWSTPQAGVPTTVKLEYTLDGTNYTTIAASTTNTGTKTWSLPTGLSSSAKVRISDPADSDSAKESAPFKIRGDLTMTAPNTGTESWEIDTIHPLTWTKKGAITAVKLQLSTDGGTTYSALTDATGANTQNIDVTGAGPTYTFNWRVPDQAGITTTQARIRVMDAADSTVYDDSNANFTIKGHVALSTPNGNQTLTVGVPYAITGTVFGPIPTVNLYLSTNSGATYTQLPTGNCDAVAVSGGAFSCNWNVPDQLNGTLRIKVTDASNGAVSDESDADFAIKGSATVTAPAAGNILFAGDPFTIKWDRTGTIGTVDLSYSVNNGAYVAIASGVDSPNPINNTYAWTVPTDQIVSANVKVKINGTNLVAPALSGVFTVKGKLTLLYPDAAGIVRTLGDTATVTWNVAGDIGNVKVEYYDGSAWSTVTTTAPQAGPFALLLDAPNTTLATVGAKVRISDADDATVTASSSNAFMVKPLVQVTAPAGNESWMVGTTQTLTWAKKGSNVSNVKIEYSKDSGATYNDVIFTSTVNDGTEPWLIPDDIQAVKTMKIRISTLPLTDPYAVTAVSTGLFQIVGGLTMVTPNDTTGVKWRVGTSANEIKWDAVGSVANVKLEYSTDSGTNWSTLVASTPSGVGPGKVYSWNIPANAPLAKDTIRIRVLDAANTNTFDVATATSSLLADFTFAAPLAGNIWVAETSNDIQWTTPTAGVPTNVKLEYTLDGTNYFTIAGTTTNTGTKTWSLPSNISSSARVRISDVADSDSAKGSAPFKIRGDLTVTSPNMGTESWEVQTYNNITWTKKGTITAVKLQLSTDSGANYVPMVDGETPARDTQNIDVSGAGPTYSFNWKVPDIAGITTTQARVRVVDANDSTVLDSSDANFTIRGRVQLSTPNGNQTLTVGVPYAITGQVFGPISSVNLYLSVNGGSTYTQLGAGNCDSVAASSGAFSCNWNVPDQLGANMKIKVTDTANSLVLDESDAVFAIKGSATVTAPVGGNTLYAGDAFNVTWSRTGTIGNVDLSYSVNNGAYVSIASGIDSPLAAGNSFPWTVPTDQIVSANVKIKIDGPNLVTPAITAPFTVKGKLTLQYPDVAGITASLGDTMTVTWNVAGDIGSVKVEYFDGAAWSTITTTAPQGGPYGLLLDAPNTTVATAAAQVRISDADDATVSDTSTNAFMVKPYLQVTSPAGNEAWVVSSTQNITWGKKGSNVSNVKIEYSKDSGATYNDVIFTSTANDGSEAWAIPDDIQPVKNMRIKISTLPLGDPYAVSALSTGLFQIVGTLTMVQPDDTTGVKWRVNTTANEIKWDATGSIVNVRLEYSVNGVGGPWNTVVLSTPSGAGAGKAYAWNIPATTPLAKDTMRLRVCDQANTSICDIATAPSSLLANFTFVTPLIGYVWVAETSNDIQWSTPQVGVPSDVKLEYTLDGSTWQSITTSTPNSGTKTWSLPTGLSNAAKVRISDVNDAFSAVDSQAFKIRGDLTLTAPNTGTESWEIDTVHPITWTKKGNITSAKLLVSTDDGANYVALVDGNSGNTQNIDVTGAGPTYTFNWRIPDLPGMTTPNARIRVMDASDATVYDSSDAKFTIKGRVALTTPNGGETLTVGGSYALTGSVFGPIGSVKLFYSTDGLTFPNPVTGCAVVGVAGGAFSCNWSVPDLIGGSLKIRVEDAGNPLVADESDAVFAIKGSATITSPSTGNIWTAGAQHTIRWDRSGSIGNVDLFYSVNNGAWSPIASGLNSPSPTGNSYDWTLPTTAIVSTNVKVRVDGVNMVAPVNSATFAVKGNITLQYPDAAGIALTLGDTLNITWTVAGDIGPVKVEYFDGTAWSTITTAAPQNGPFGLLLDAPNTTVATAAAQVRISDPDDASVIDTSTNAFTVKPFLQVTGPAGGETYVVSSSQTLTWNAKGSNVASVKMEYSKDGGLNFNDVIAASATNSGSYLWQPIPDDIQSVSNMKVRVSTLPLAAPYAVNAVSNGLFKISGALTLTTPQATDRWGVGTLHDIKWQRTGSIGNVRLTYSTDGTNYNPIVDTYPGGNGDTGYTWTIPNVAGIVSNTVTVRLSDVADSSVNNISPQFKIVPSFTMTAPATGQRLLASRPFTLTWTRQGLNPTINLYYSKDNFAGQGIVIASGAANTGSYLWNVPDDLSNTVTARVTYPSDETVFADSSPFLVVPEFTVIAPNSSTDKWDVGSSQQIKWSCSSANVPQVTLYYSTDGGTTYPFQLTTTANNTGAVDAQRSWTWPTIPDTISDSLRVKVVSNTDLQAFDASDSNAKLKAFFQVLTPSASGITVKVADVYNVTWNWTGSVANVRLDYSLDDFATLGTNITPTTLNDGVFEWTVPDSITTNMKIRVRSTTDIDAFDVSDNPFKVRGNLALQTPNGANQFMIGFPHDITWQTTGSIGTVDVVAYSTQMGDTGFPYTLASPYTIVSALANTPNGSKTYSWNPVPDLASPNVRVRVIDSLDPTVVYDDSDANFRIQGSFTVTYPNAAGEVLVVGDPVSLTWNKTGSSITAAKISYSTAGMSGPWTTIQENEGSPNDGVVNNDGTYVWTVPDAISTSVFLKIEDPNDNTVFDVSDNAAKIQGRLTMDFPAGNERWVVNESHQIAWTTVGTIPTVNIVYTKNGFVGTLPIATGIPNATGANSYNWVIPDDVSTTVKVRVSNTADAMVFANSNQFKIDYYLVTFEVRDLLSNKHIDTLNVSGTHTNPAFTWAASGLASPVTKGLPAGAWTVTWTQNNYGDQGVPVVADRDQTIKVYMETKVVHVWEAVTEMAYDSANDMVSLSSTLRRDGVRVEGATYAGISFYLGSTLVKEFYTPRSVDGTTGEITPNPVTPPDAQGFYNFQWGDEIPKGQPGNVPTNLIPGRVYNVVTRIINTTGGNIVTPRTFTITQEAILQNVTDTVNNKLDTSLSQVNSDIQTSLNTQTATMSNKLDQQIVVIDTKLTSQSNDLNAKLNQQSNDLNASLAGQTNSLNNALNTQTATIDSKMNQQTNAIQGQMNVQTSAIASTLKSFETKADEKVAALQGGVVQINAASDDLKVNAALQEGTTSRFSGKLVMPVTVLMGSTNIVLIYIGPKEGLTPLLTMTTRDNKSGKEIFIKQDVPMTADPAQPDMYTYTIDKVSSPPYPAGGVVAVRIIAKNVYKNELLKDKTFDNFVSGSFVVETTTLSTLEGLVAGQSGVKPMVQDALNAVRAVQSTLGTNGNVGAALENLSEKVGEIPKAMAKDGPTTQMRNAINEVAQQMKTLAGDNMGYDLSQIVGKALDESSGLREVRKKTDTVQGTTELMQILLERKLGGVDAPVVHTIIE